MTGGAMGFDFRPHDRPRLGICARCGRELVARPGSGLQDVDGFVQCRPRGESYEPAPRIGGRVRLHALGEGDQ